MNASTRRLMAMLGTVLLFAASFAVAQDEHHFSEATTAASTAGTAWQDYTTVTFTSAGGDYLVLGTAEVGGSSTSYNALAQLTVDGTAWSGYDAEPKTAANYQTFVTHKVVTLTAGTHTIKLQFCSENAAATATIRNARLVVWALLSYLTDADQDAQANVTDDRNRRGLPRLQRHGGRLPDCRHRRTAAQFDRLQHPDVPESGWNCTGYGFARRQGHHRLLQLRRHPQSFPGRRHAYPHAHGQERIGNHVHPPPAPSPRFRWRGSPTGTPSPKASRTTTSTTFQTKTTLTFTPSAARDVLILNTGRIQESSVSYNTNTRVTLDTVAQTAGVLQPQDTTDYATTALAKIVNLSAAAHTVTAAYASSSSAGTARLKNSRLLAIALDGPQSGPFSLANGYFSIAGHQRDDHQPAS